MCLDDVLVRFIIDDHEKLLLNCTCGDLPDGFFYPHFWLVMLESNIIYPLFKGLFGRLVSLFIDGRSTSIQTENSLQ